MKLINFFILQLGMFLKKNLNGNCLDQTKSQFLEAISKYLSKRTTLVSSDISNFCICGGKGDGTWNRSISFDGSVELLDLQQRQLEVLLIILGCCNVLSYHLSFTSLTTYPMKNYIVRNSKSSSKMHITI